MDELICCIAPSLRLSPVLATPAAPGFPQPAWGSGLRGDDFVSGFGSQISDLSRFGAFRGSGLRSQVSGLGHQFSGIDFRGCTAFTASSSAVAHFPKSCRTRVSALSYQVSDFSCFESQVLGLGFRVSDFGHRVPGLYSLRHTQSHRHTLSLERNHTP